MPVRTCPFCEATCGLEVTLDGDRVVKVRGDEHDVFSRGFLCPKGTSLKELHEDPDRLRAPLVRDASGELVEATWDEAFARVEALLGPVLEVHGRDAVGVYLGNPSAHSLGPMLYGRVLLKALGSKNLFSASTVDQMPKHVSAGHMFGSPATIPVPDLDRTQYLLMLGANPWASNGSLMTAPDVRGRLRGIRARGGTVVVVDPRRTRTAAEADLHVPIRPGTDALWLMALVQVVLAEGLGAALDPERFAGVAELASLSAPFTPEAVEPATGVPAAVTREVARGLAAAAPGCVYGRIGTTTQVFGTTASWLVDVLNAVTGNLDVPGGAMFPLPAHGRRGTGSGRGFRTGRWQSRVRGLPEVMGELPVACLAEEITEPGEGRLRALITVAGNPVVSTPGAEGLDAALEDLDALICVDLYVNETTRHADVVLPAPSPLEKAHYDLALYGFAVRNVANWSEALLPLPDGRPDEWEILLRLVGIVTGQGAGCDIAMIDAFVARGLVQREVGDTGSALHGRDVDEVLAEVGDRVGPERMVDVLLRGGAHGLTLADLEVAPHGIDLGALEPRLPAALSTASGKVELAPPALVADVERLAHALDDRTAPGDLLLVGRRDLRSNNSWMHNLPVLVRGPERCTVWVHPADASRLGVADGAAVAVRSRVGQIELPATVTEDVMPGVVSIPHGWGHGGAGVRLRVAATVAGANSNVLADPELVDPVSGNAVLNGIPVTLAPVGVPAGAAA